VAGDGAQSDPLPPSVQQPREPAPHEHPRSGDAVLRGPRDAGAGPREPAATIRSSCEVSSRT
jgi:hypothetical protein